MFDVAVCRSKVARRSSSSRFVSKSADVVVFSAMVQAEAASPKPGTKPHTLSAQIRCTCEGSGVGVGVGGSCLGKPGSAQARETPQAKTNASATNDNFTTCLPSQVRKALMRFVRCTREGTGWFHRRGLCVCNTTLTRANSFRRPKIGSRAQSNNGGNNCGTLCRARRQPALRLKQPHRSSLRKEHP